MQKRVKYNQKRLKNGKNEYKIKKKKRKNINKDIVIVVILLICTKIDIIKLLILQYDIKSS